MRWRITTGSEMKKRDRAWIEELLAEAEYDFVPPTDGIHRPLWLHAPEWRKAIYRKRAKHLVSRLPLDRMVLDDQQS